jgi:hypothetical protein
MLTPDYKLANANKAAILFVHGGYLQNAHNIGVVTIENTCFIIY